MATETVLAPGGGLGVSPEVAVSLGAVTVFLKGTEAVVATASDGMGVVARQN